MKTKYSTFAYPKLGSVKQCYATFVNNVTLHLLIMKLHYKRILLNYLDYFFLI